MKLLRDTWLMFKRSMLATLRNPVWLIFGLFQPVCYILLFAPLIDHLSRAPGFPAGNGLAVFTPGLLIMLGIYGTTFVGFDLIAELRSGVIERLRVTPVSRLALPLGRALRDILNLLIQSVLLLCIAWLLGLHANLSGLLLMLVLMTCIGLTMASCSYALALLLKDENGLASILNIIILPLVLLSGIILPLTLAPTQIRFIAAFNPFAYAVEAARALFQDNVGEIAVWRGFGLMFFLALLALLWATRSFKRATA